MGYPGEEEERLVLRLRDAIFLDRSLLPFPLLQFKDLGSGLEVLEIQDLGSG